MRVVYYLAASLDGRIAGPEHDLAFLQTLSGGPSGYGYDEFIAEIDGLVVGASSWDFMKDYSWTYGDRPVWVVTHRDDAPTIEGAAMHVFSGDIADLVRELESAGLQRVWVIGGGNVVGQFLAADRLDEVIITLAPTFVGRGPAVADGEFPLRRFRLVAVEHREGDDGVQLRYERDRSQE
ncbi:MAG TPA: dihydrofolate reductase family protein [Gaiellaceae bacterium]|nr:dihydrofolate reductase family protein [Gaiellaceae bacterium]